MWLWPRPVLCNLVTRVVKRPAGRLAGAADRRRGCLWKKVSMQCRAMHYGWQTDQKAPWQVRRTAAAYARGHTLPRAALHLPALLPAERRRQAELRAPSCVSQWRELECHCSRTQYLWVLCTARTAGELLRDVVHRVAAVKGCERPSSRCLSCRTPYCR